MMMNNTRMALRRFSVVGFTLVEILLAVAILAIIAVSMIPSYKEAVKEAKGKAETENLRAIQSAKMSWAAEHPGESLTDPAQLAPYLADGRLPSSPWGKGSAFDYLCVTDLDQVVMSPVNGNSAYEPKGGKGGTDLTSNGYNDLGVPAKIAQVGPGPQSPLVPDWNTLRGLPAPTPPPPVQQSYILTLDVNPPHAGTAIGSGFYAANSMASADVNSSDPNGYRFREWIGDPSIAGTTKSVTNILMNNNKAATADMDVRLTINVHPSAAASSTTINPGEGNNWLPAGNTTISATTDGSWQLGSWIVSNGNSPANPNASSTSLDLQIPTTLQASMRPRLTVRYLPDDSSVSDSIAYITPDGQYHDYMSYAPIRITTHNGARYVFSHWSGDFNGQGTFTGNTSDASILMDAPKTVIANMIPGPLEVRLLLHVIGNGTVFPAPDKVHYYVIPAGHEYIDVPLSVTPGSSTTSTWHFDGWYRGYYAMGNIIAPYSPRLSDANLYNLRLYRTDTSTVIIVAKLYEKVHLTLDVHPPGEGRVFQNNSQYRTAEYIKGNTVSIRAEANYLRRFGHWATLSGVSVSDWSNPNTNIVLDKHTHLRAVFEADHEQILPIRLEAYGDPHIGLMPLQAQWNDNYKNYMYYWPTLDSYAYAYYWYGDDYEVTEDGRVRVVLAWQDDDDAITISYKTKTAGINNPTWIDTVIYQHSRKESSGNWKAVHTQIWWSGNNFSSPERTTIYEWVGDTKRPLFDLTVAKMRYSNQYYLNVTISNIYSTVTKTFSRFGGLMAGAIDKWYARASKGLGVNLSGSVNLIDTFDDPNAYWRLTYDDVWTKPGDNQFFAKERSIDYWHRVVNGLMYSQNRYWQWHGFTPHSLFNITGPVGNPPQDPFGAY